MADLERIGDDLDDLLRRLGIPRPTDAARLFEAWDEAAGEPWASRSEPVGMDDGELVVEAVDGASATLLRYQTGALVERLNDGLGAPLVRSVRVRVRSPKKRF